MVSMFTYVGVLFFRYTLLKSCFIALLLTGVAAEEDSHAYQSSGGSFPQLAIVVTVGASSVQKPEASTWVS
jgi:hypothetical protein